MKQQGVKIVWDKEEETSDEEEKEVFDHKERSIRKIFKLLVSTSVVPFMAILEPLMFQEKSFTKLKREITLNTNLFQDFVEWFLYYQIFDERDLKYTKH